MNAVERVDAFNRRLIPVESGMCSYCGKEFCEPSEHNLLFDVTSSAISGDLPFGGSLICANCIDQLDHQFGDLFHISGEETSDFIDIVHYGDRGD